MPDLIVRFVTEKDFVSAGIRWVTYSEFSHVELGLPDGTWLGAHASGGVQIRPADYMIPSLERVYAIPVSETNYSIAMEFARSKVGTTYSLSDIAAIFFRAHLHTVPHGIICSWLMLDILEAAGIYPLNVLAHFNYKIDPDRLHLSPIFRGRCIRQSAVPK